MTKTHIIVIALLMVVVHFSHAEKSVTETPISRPITSQPASPQMNPSFGWLKPPEHLIDHPKLKEAGFPFDQIGCATYTEIINGYVLDIAEVLVQMHENGEFSDERRKETIEKTLSQFRGQLYATQGLNSLSFLMSDMPIQPWERLLAVFAISTLEESITDVDVYLEYAYIQLVSPDILFESSFRPRNRMKLDSEQQLALYPASRAIVTHATDAVPQLHEIVRDTKKPEWLRIRAVEFLYIVDDQLTESDVFEGLDDDFLYLCRNRIGGYRPSWLNPIYYFITPVDTQASKKKLDIIKKINSYLP